MRALPRVGGSAGVSSVAERDHRDAIEVREADVRERRADLQRVVQLAAGAERHRRARVDEK